MRAFVLFLSLSLYVIKGMHCILWFSITNKMNSRRLVDAKLYTSISCCQFAQTEIHSWIMANALRESALDKTEILRKLTQLYCRIWKCLWTNDGCSSLQFQFWRFENGIFRIQCFTEKVTVNETLFTFFFHLFSIQTQLFVSLSALRLQQRADKRFFYWSNFIISSGSRKRDKQTFDASVVVVVYVCGTFLTFTILYLNCLV